MSNTAYFNIKIAGDKTAIRKFIEETKDFCNVIETGENYKIFSGYCPKSVYVAFIGNGKFSKYTQNGVKLEAFSEEPMLCFEEHYIFKDGKCLVNEVRDTIPHFLCDYKTKEEAERVIGEKITDYDFQNNGIYMTGGFDKRFE